MCIYIYIILDLVFSLSTLKLWLYCLYSSIVSSKKFDIIFIFVPL